MAIIIEGHCIPVRDQCFDYLMSRLKNWNCDGQAPLPGIDGFVVDVLIIVITLRVTHRPLQDHLDPYRSWPCENEFTEETVGHIRACHTFE